MARTAKKATTKKRVSRKKKTATAEKSSEVPVKAESAEPGKTGGALAAWDDIDRLFDDFLKRRWLRPFSFDWPPLEGFPSLLEKAPSIDIVDRDKEVVVRAEVPGIDKKDLDVSIAERTLTIKGSTRSEEKKEEDDYYRQEIRSGTFSRTVTLPTDVDSAKAKASFKDGVVELHLPKVRESKRHKISLR